MIATTIDCSDVTLMASFWSALLDVEIRGIQDQFAFLGSPDGSGISIWLQDVPEPRAGKTRVHLDLSTTDLDATLALIERLGGTVGERTSGTAMSGASASTPRAPCSM